MRQDAGSQEKELRQSRSLLMTIEQDLEENTRETVKQKERVNSLRLSKEDTSDGGFDLARADRADDLASWSWPKARRKSSARSSGRSKKARVQTEIAVNRLDVELDNLLRKLSEEYELSYELAKERYPVPEDVHAAQQRGARPETQHLRVWATSTWARLKNIERV